MKTLLCAAALLLVSTIALAQSPNSRLFWIRITDSAGGGDSVLYGFDPSATLGYDALLGEMMAGPDPEGFYAKWTSTPGRPNYIGSGLVKLDLHPYPTYGNDTFSLVFKNDDSLAKHAGVVLKWVCATYIANNVDSMLLIDPSHTFLPQPLNMASVDSVVLPDVYDSGGVNPQAPHVQLLICLYQYNATPCTEQDFAFTDSAVAVEPLRARFVGEGATNCSTLDSMHFQYGTTVQYGKEAAGTLNTDGSYGAWVGNLLPNTTYHMRAVGYFTGPICNSPPVYGDDMSFTTGAPPASVFWINIADGDNASDSLIFGNHTGATWGVDSLLGEMYDPAVPAGFDARWTSIAGRPNTWGVGLAPKDLRGITGPAQKDTFSLWFTNPDSLAKTVSAVLRWPASDYLAARTDSMILVDPTGTLIPSPVSMFTADSIVLAQPYNPSGPNPNAPTVKLLIYKYGIHQPLVDAVRKGGAAVPASFRLGQNYPNPFNPTTTIHFEIPKESPVRLSIFDILGREVAQLVDGRKAAGSYDLPFDASKLASGIYFYRLSAGDFTDTKKMLLLK
ncbi:MAG TPA: T9SS type A sorting domain-containing protein [Bacteroidota bacterium]|nr:T9SS type A sorting domain-containing protein [Bacteroidota bacterium]